MCIDPQRPSGDTRAARLLSGDGVSKYCVDMWVVGEYAAG